MASREEISNAVSDEFIRHPHNTSFLIDRCVEEKVVSGGSLELLDGRQIRAQRTDIRSKPQSANVVTLGLNKQSFVSHRLTATQFDQEIDTGCSSALGVEIVEQVYSEIDRNIYRDIMRMLHDSSKTRPEEYVFNQGCGKLDLTTLLEAQARLGVMSPEFDVWRMLWVFDPVGRAALMGVAELDYVTFEEGAKLRPANIATLFGSPVMITQNISKLPNRDPVKCTPVERTPPPGSESEPPGFRVFAASAWSVNENRMTIEMEPDHYILPGEIVTLTVPGPSGSGAPLMPSFTEPARVLESHDNYLIIEHTRANASRAEVKGFVTVHSKVNLLLQPRLIRTLRQTRVYVDVVDDSRTSNYALRVRMKYGVAIFPDAAVAVLSSQRALSSPLTD